MKWKTWVGVVVLVFFAVIALAYLLVHHPLVSEDTIPAAGDASELTQ